MSKIVIGTAHGNDFVLPRETVTSTIVILGGKGMGKTNLGGDLIEEVDAQGDRWCVIDPLGVWWGLRHSLDGKGPGIECVILGGPHGDIPIEATGGAVAADLVVDEQSNVIIDISRKSNGEMWGMGERIRFAKDFAKRLFQRQGELVDGHRREPIFVELDEAATFIPQMFPSGNVDIAECIGAWQTLVEWGRNVGIGVALLTQRSARINKSVTEVADALFSFRIVGPNSLKAVTDWLGEHVPKKKVGEHVETLRSLNRGSCLVVSPGWLKFEGVVDVRLRHTFDSSATPKPGERQRRVTGKAAKPDLVKYQERMKETIERAKSEDPKELRKQVAELKGKLAKAENAQPAPSSPGKTVVKADPQQTRTIQQLRTALEDAVKIIAKINAVGFEGAEVKPEEISAAIEKAAAEVGKIAGQKIAFKRRELEALKADVNRLLAKLNARLKDENVKIDVDVVKSEPMTVRPQAQPSSAKPPRVPVARPEGDLSGPEQNILDQLAELDALGITQPEKAQLALMAGYTNSRSGGFSEPLGRLLAYGYLSYPQPGLVKISDEGRIHARPVDSPMSVTELHERLGQKLGGPEAKLLREIIGIYPDQITKEELGAKLGYTNVRSGGFSEPIGRLRSLGIIHYPEKNAVKAADWLFLESA